MPAAVKPKGIKKVINVASQIAPFAGLALKQTIPGRIIGAGITGGSRIAEGLTRGETAGQAIKSGIKQDALLFFDWVFLVQHIRNKPKKG